MEKPTELKPHTDFGERLIGLAERLDNWCNAETDITHRQARVGVGMAVLAGAVVINGWDNSMAPWRDMVLKNMNLVRPGGEQLVSTGRIPLTELVKDLIEGPVEVHQYLGPEGNWSNMFTVDLNPDQRREALDALLRVTNRQEAKDFTALLSTYAGIGVAGMGRLLGSQEKIKGSTGVGQWAAGVIKYIGEVL